MRKLIGYLEQQSKVFFVFLGILLTLLICVIDFLTKDFFVFEFYIIAIVIVTWFAGRNAGFFMALISAIGEIILDIIETPYHSNPLIHWWNFFMNFSFFLIIIYFLIGLKNALEIRSKFTSTVSHELRTPVSVIKEGIRMTKDGLCGDVNDEQKDMLNTVLMNANRLGCLIDDILDFQKYESGKMKLVFAKNDMNKIVQDAYKGIELLGKEKGLNVVFNMSEDLPKIKSDKDRITQVIINLLSNAIKFNDKGTITVSTTKNGGNVQVAVQDTGCGIKPEDISRLFKSFEQVGASNKQGEKGTGLGLVISKEIIVLHGGKIWAESGLNKGTTFYFTLPI